MKKDHMCKNEMGYIIEACVETIQQAIIAEKKGANRIELCGDLKVGGITPSYGLIHLTKELLTIPVFVIIRPRGGDFVYNNLEIEIMKRDIKACLDLNVDGLVFGILKENKQIDLERTKELINYTKSIYIFKTNFINNIAINPDFDNFTFHMAFDEIEGPLDNKLDSLKSLSQLGVNKILTKGCKTKAPDGLNYLKIYNEYVNSFDNSNKIVIMPGGGVTFNNLKEIAEFTGCNELHGTKILAEL